MAAVALGAAAAALPAGHAFGGETAPDERPSLIFLIAAVGRDDIRASGHPKIRTPDIDRLARQGMRFDRAFLTCSMCSPSRCSVLTGRDPRWLAENDAHRPRARLRAHPPYAPGDIVLPPFLPDLPEVRSDFAMWYDEIPPPDDYTFRVLEEVEKQGAAGNTFDLFLSSNGRPFPRCKLTLRDSGLKTAWIVRFPGRERAGSACSGLVGAVDLAPTILPLAGLKPEPAMQGRSFAALLADPAARRPDEYDRETGERLPGVALVQQEDD